MTEPDAIGDLRRKSVSGVVAVLLRGVGVRGLGLVTSIALARLLLPREFGLLAFGFTIVAIGTFLTDAGLAAGLIRTAQEPTRRQLSAVLGLQLAVTVVLVGGGAALLWGAGMQGQVTALMAASLLPATFRVPAVVQLERTLRFKDVAVAEVLEMLAYTVAAVGLVLAGAGVWGVAAAAVLRPVVGAVVLQRKAPMRVLRPVLDLPTVKPLLAFGLTFQATALLALVRDQGVNLATAAIAGNTVLGYWSLAQRLMLVPFLLFESLWRVSYPAIARLLQAGHDVREDLQRALVLGGLVTGAVVVPLAATAPSLVPLLFGDAWLPVVPVIPLAAAGLMLSGPLLTVAGGWLAATGRIRVVAGAQACTLVVWAVLLPLLLPAQGVTAHGIAWAVACVVDAAVVGAALQRYAGVRVLRHLLPAAVCALAAGAAGYALADGRDPGVLVLLGVGAGSVAVYLLLAAVLVRDGLRDAVATLLRIVKRVS